jgi:hypothetical protein
MGTPPAQLSHSSDRPRFRCVGKLSRRSGVKSRSRAPSLVQLRNMFNFSKEPLGSTEWQRLLFASMFDSGPPSPLWDGTSLIKWKSYDCPIQSRRLRNVARWRMEDHVMLRRPSSLLLRYIPLHGRLDSLSSKHCHVLCIFGGDCFTRAKVPMDFATLRYSFTFHLEIVWIPISGFLQAPFSSAPFFRRRV